MIHYQLRCAADHEFDGWFADSAGFEAQAARGLVECPLCGDRRVERALMTPAVPRKGRKRPAAARPDAESVPAAPGTAGPPAAASAEPEILPPGRQMAGADLPAHMRAVLQRLRAEVERNCDNVGTEFAAEARRMHRGESERRAIYGDTTPEEAEALADEGIEVSRIPWVPRADG
jgi:hypothetical protein